MRSRHAIASVWGKKPAYSAPWSERWDADDMRRSREKKHRNRYPGRVRSREASGAERARRRERPKNAIPTSEDCRGRWGSRRHARNTREECEELHVRRRVLGPAAAFEERALGGEWPLRHVADKRQERRRVRGHAQWVVHRTRPHRRGRTGPRGAHRHRLGGAAGMGNRVAGGAAASKLGSDSLESEADVGEPVRDRLGAFLRGLQRSEELVPALLLGSVGHGQAGAGRPWTGTVCRSGGGDSGRPLISTGRQASATLCLSARTHSSLTVRSLRNSGS